MQPPCTRGGRDAQVSPTLCYCCRLHCTRATTLCLSPSSLSNAETTESRVIPARKLQATPNLTLADQKLQVSWYTTRVLVLHCPPFQLRHTLNTISVVGNSGKGSQDYFGEAVCEPGIDPSAPVWSLLFERAKPASLCLTVTVGCFIRVNIPFSNPALNFCQQPAQTRLTAEDSKKPCCRAVKTQSTHTSIAAEQTGGSASSRAEEGWMLRTCILGPKKVLTPTAGSPCI